VVRRVAVAAGVAVLVVVLGGLGWMWYSSLLPDSYNVMDYGKPDYGGAPVPAYAAAHHHQGGRSLASLRGPTGRPDARFTLVARHADVRLASGSTTDALTFNGRVPGPELRVHEGDLVEVTVLNKDVDEGVSIHWHGVDVPNAEDGVAGVTQNAVLPGGRHVHRFRAEQVGTFWYHSHQVASKQVRRGLLGALVIEPRGPAPNASFDRVIVAHELGGRSTLDGSETLRRQPVPRGADIRLRLINAENSPRRFSLGGTSFRVLAIDGTELNEPGTLRNTVLELAAGGRYDIGFTMPATPVSLALDGTKAAVALGPDGTAAALGEEEPVFDPLGYGKPARTPFGPRSRFDRSFTFEIGQKPGFLDGRPGRHWTINGGIYPDVPVFMVRRGDLVKVTIVNDTGAVHPMHLHGHHALVLSRDGVPATGSPWWTDTLDVRPHERFEVAFRADNPGVWMDHCHNLRHAAEGLTMHLAYEGVTTPFVTGGHTHNTPE
jgi:FtsP/CotA-like multicopper oxidase with cupredoxin domain